MCGGGIAGEGSEDEALAEPPLEAIEFGDVTKRLPRTAPAFESNIALANKLTLGPKVSGNSDGLFRLSLRASFGPSEFGNLVEKCQANHKKCSPSVSQAAGRAQGRHFW